MKEKFAKSTLNKLKGYSFSDHIETEELILLNEILTANKIKTHFYQRDKNPEFDGTLEITSSVGKKKKKRDVPIATFWVQIKPLSEKQIREKKVNIPVSLLLASRSRINDPVLFIGVNRYNKLFCWIYISDLDPKLKEKQITFTQSFSSENIVSKKDTKFVNNWLEIYEERRKLFDSRKITNMNDLVNEIDSLNKNIKKFIPMASTESKIVFNEKGVVHINASNKQNFFKSLYEAIEQGNSISFDKKDIISFKIIFENINTTIEQILKEDDKLTFSLSTPILDATIVSEKDELHSNLRFQLIRGNNFKLFNDYLTVKIIKNDFIYSYNINGIDIFKFENFLKLLKIFCYDWSLLIEGKKIFTFKVGSEIVSLRNLTSIQVSLYRKFKKVQKLFPDSFTIKPLIGGDIYWLNFLSEFQSKYTDNHIFEINIPLVVLKDIFSLPLNSPQFFGTLTFTKIFSDRRYFNFFYDKKTFLLTVKVKSQSYNIKYFESEGNSSIIHLYINGNRNKVQIEWLKDENLIYEEDSFFLSINWDKNLVFPIGLTLSHNLNRFIPCLTEDGEIIRLNSF